jgi:hypothetical protein
MLIGIVVTMVLNAGVGSVVTFSSGRGWALPLIFISWALLWAYSYAPLRLSYRGGEELLQALGVGFLLLFFGYYAQAVTPQHFPWRCLLFVMPLQLGAASSTAPPMSPERQALDLAIAVDRAARLVIEAGDPVGSGWIEQVRRLPFQQCPLLGHPS